MFECLDTLEINVTEVQREIYSKVLFRLIIDDFDKFGKVILFGH